MLGSLNTSDLTNYWNQESGRGDVWSLTGGTRILIATPVGVLAELRPPPMPVPEKKISWKAYRNDENDKKRESSNTEQELDGMDNIHTFLWEVCVINAVDATIDILSSICS